MSQFEHLPEYLEWANGRVLAMLRNTPSDEGTRIFSHLLAAEQVWAARIIGEAPPCPVWPVWTLDECADMLPRSVARYREIVLRHDPAREITYRNQHGDQYTSTEGDILLHIFAHGAYHRGQIAQELRRSGHEIVDTDYILFRRE